MQMQTAGSFAIPYHIRGAKLFLVISWQPQSPSVIARRLFSMDSQRTLQTNAISEAKCVMGWNMNTMSAELRKHILFMS